MQDKKTPPVSVHIDPEVQKIWEDLYRSIKDFDVFTVETTQRITTLDGLCLAERCHQEGITVSEPLTLSYVYDEKKASDRFLQKGETRGSYYGATVINVNGFHSLLDRVKFDLRRYSYSPLSEPPKEDATPIALFFDSQPLSVILFDNRYRSCFVPDRRFSSEHGYSISDGETDLRLIDNKGITCVYGIARTHSDNISKERVKQVILSYFS